MDFKAIAQRAQAKAATSPTESASEMDFKAIADRANSAVDITQHDVAGWYQGNGNLAKKLDTFSQEEHWGNPDADLQAEIETQKQKARDVQRYINVNRDKFANYDSVVKEYDNYIGFLDEAENYVRNQNRVYSSFANRDAYDNAVFISNLQNMSSEDVKKHQKDKTDRINAEIAELQKELDAIPREQEFIYDEYKYETAEDEARYAELQKKIAELQAQLDPILYVDENGKNIKYADLIASKEQKEAIEEQIAAAKEEGDWEELTQYSTTNPNGVMYVAAPAIGSEEFNVDWIYEAINNSDVPSSTLNADQNLAVMYMTEDEKKLYNYLSRKVRAARDEYDTSEGYSEAYIEEGLPLERYWQSLVPVLEERQYEKHLESLKILTEKEPFWGWVLARFHNVAAIPEYLTNSVEFLFTGKSKENKSARAASTIDAVNMENTDWMLGDWDAFDTLYGVGSSLGDMALTAPLALISPWLSAAALGTEAAAHAKNAALDRGMEGWQAELTGLGAGAAEAIFERFSIGQLNAMKEVGVSGLKDTAMNIAKSMVTNASEEALTELANGIYDILVNGDFSQFETDMRLYMQQGMSEAEARQKAYENFGIQLAESAGSGMLMGLPFGGGASFASWRSTSKLGKTVNDVDFLVELGKQFEGTRAHELALEVESGNTKDAKLGALLSEITAEMENAGEDVSNKAVDAAKKNLEQIANGIAEQATDDNFGNITDADVKEATEHLGFEASSEDIAVADAALDADEKALDEMESVSAQQGYVAPNSSKQVKRYQTAWARNASRALSRNVYFYDGADHDGAESGFVGEDGAIYVNTKSPTTRNSVAIVLGHEYVHTVEGTDEYNALSKAIFENAVFQKSLSNFQNEDGSTGTTIDGMIAAIQKQYAAAGRQLSAEAVKTEIVAQFVAERILQDGRTLAQFAKTGWFAQFLVRLRRLLARLASKDIDKAEIVKLERLLQRAVRAAKQNPAATKVGRGKNMIAVENIENDKKVWYSQANTIAMQWAGDPDRKSGDTRVVPIDLYESMLVIANGNGGFEAVYIGNHLEVNEFEQLYARKDRSIYSNLEIARRGKRTDSWSLRDVGNRRYDARNSRSSRSGGLQDNSSRNNEYLRRSDHKALRAEVTPRYTTRQDVKLSWKDSKYFQALEEGKISVAGNMIDEAAEDNGFDRKEVINGRAMFVSSNTGQQKDADVVTYDEEGYVIPWSQRFDVDKSDPRYSIPFGFSFNPNAKAPVQNNLKSQSVDTQAKRLMELADAKGDTQLSLPDRTAVDTAYMDAINRDDMDTAQRMVDEAAKAAGYAVKAYHGTSEFGFTEFDSDKSDDKLTLFFCDDIDVASTYAGKDVNTTRGVHTANYIKSEKGTPYTEAQLQQAVALVQTKRGASGRAKIDVKKQTVKYDGTTYHAKQIVSMANRISGEGIYGVVLNTSDMMEVDAANNDWKHITNPETGEVMTTRDLAQYARENGYQGVKVSNLFDFGGLNSTAQATMEAEGRGAATVYMLFDGERVKSADPVTYDDNGNVIPLSQRFNAENPDIRYSIPFGFSFNPNAKAPVQNNLKSQSVDAQAKRLMELADAKGDRAEFTDLLRGYYDYMASGHEMTWEGVRDAAAPAVEWLSSHYAGLSTIDEHAREALKETRAVKVRMSADQKAEAAAMYGTYGAYHRKALGTMVFANDAKITLEERWGELADLYPEYFDASVNATDMPVRLLDIADELRHTNTAALEREENMAQVLQDIEGMVHDSYWQVEEVRSEKERYEDRVYDLKKKHRAEIRDERAAKDRAVEEERERGDLRVKKERARAKEIERREREWQRIQRERDADRRRRTELKDKIRKKVNKLNTQLLNGTKEKNVKLGLREAVAYALNAVEIIDGEDYDRSLQRRIDYLDQQMYEAVSQEDIDAFQKQRDDLVARGDRMKERLEKLSAAYSAILADNDSQMQIYKHDAEMVRNRVDAVVAIVGETPLRYMNTRQLEAVLDMYTLVQTTIDNANKIFKQGKAEDLQSNATAIIDELSDFSKAEIDGYTETAKPKEMILDFSWNELKPVYAFRRLGSERFMELYQELRRGEDVAARDVQDASEYARLLREKYGWDSWDLKKTHKFKTVDGRMLPLTVPQMMSLYAYSKRPQAQKHLEKGGIMFSDRETYKAERGIFDVKRSSRESWKVDPILINTIAKTLTPEQIHYVNGMQSYLSTTMGEKGNEVARVMWGIDIFKEKNYFPLKSSHDFVFSQSTANPLVSLKSSGMTKQTTPHAANPIILEGFDTVWAEHVVQMSNYHGFVVPIDNMNKVLNYADYINADHAESVTTVIRSVFGDSAVKYIEKLIQDVNGGVKAEASVAFFPQLIGKAKKTAVAFSMSTVMQQPTAILRAMAMIAPKYFVGKYDMRKHSTKWAELKTYAPVAILKEIGGFDTTSGRGLAEWLNQKSYKGIAKVGGLFTDAYYRDDKLMAPAMVADEIGWITIWEAVKREQAKLMDTASAEFLKHCGERFTEVIEHTQVYDSTLSRSGLMRSKSEYMKMATAFMGEPTTSFNMLFDALIDVKRGASKLHAGRVIGSVYVSTVFAAIAASAVYALRDDDEDEAYLDKWAEQFGKKLSSELWVHNMIPFVRDVASIFDGWDVERMDMALVGDLVNAWNSIDNPNKHWWRKLEDMAGAVGALFGVPAKNVLRTGRELFNAVRFAVDDIAPGNQWEHFAAGFTRTEVLSELEKLNAAIAGEVEGTPYADNPTFAALEDLYDAALKEIEAIENDDTLTEAEKLKKKAEVNPNGVLIKPTVGSSWALEDGSLLSNHEDVKKDVVAQLEALLKIGASVTVESQEYASADTPERVQMVEDVYSDMKAFAKGAISMGEPEEALDAIGNLLKMLEREKRMRDPNVVDAVATIRMKDKTLLGTNEALAKMYPDVFDKTLERVKRENGNRFEYTKDGEDYVIHLNRASDEELEVYEEKMEAKARAMLKKIYAAYDPDELEKLLKSTDPYTLYKRIK